MQLRKVAVSVSLLALSLYILLPTADEIIIHPILGLLLANALNLPLAYGVLLSIIIYRGVGSACLLGTLLIGGKPIYRELKERIRKKPKPKKKQTHTTFSLSCFKIVALILNNNCPLTGALKSLLR
jgi:uncharacterized membrane protein